MEPAYSVIARARGAASCGGNRSRSIRHIGAALLAVLVALRAAAQCGPPDNTCIVTPANGPRVINSWPSSDSKLDWVSLDASAAYYAERYPEYAVFDTPIIASLQADAANPSPTTQPTCNYMLTANALHAAAPNVVLGTYLSGNDVRPPGASRYYPSDALFADQVPNPSYLAGTAWANWDGSLRWTIDLTDSAARNWFLGALANEINLRTHCLAEQKLSFVYMDNIRHPISGYRIPGNDACNVEDCSNSPRPPECQCTSISWSTLTSFLASLRSQIGGMRIVINVAGLISDWTQAESNQMLSAVDGICHERPFDKNYARVDMAPLLLEISYYQQWLAAGKTVLWAATQCENARRCSACPGCDQCPEPTANIHEERVLAAMAMLIRQPGQSIFVSRVYYRTRPDWALWPQQFGTPLSDYQIVSGQVAPAPMVLTRKFQNGRIWVNLTGSLCNRTTATAVQTGVGPMITDPPRNTLACPARTTALRIGAVGIGAVRYQWKKNGLAISGARSADLVFNSVAITDAGTYTCVVTDSEGSRESTPVTLTVGAGRPGDTNGDGRVDNFDINPFVAAILNQSLATTCAFDANGDGSFDNFDISAMVELIVNFGELP